MVASGLSPAQALIAATRGGAAAMGRGNELGTIEPGKIADMVVLRADPLVDVLNARAIEAVIKGGEVIPVADLMALLARRG
jgi:imidazolonepropionase-like amidohydrolase